MPTQLRPDGGADADGAVTSLISPDGSALLVLTTGYNSTYYTLSGAPVTHAVLDVASAKATRTRTAAAQWIFVYDIRKRIPKLVQRIELPLSYDGLCWDPLGRRFYASGGSDDRVYVFKAVNGPAVSAEQSWAADPPFINLGHNSHAEATLTTQDGGLLKGTRADNGNAKAQGLTFSAVAAGLAISNDGRTLYVANMQNDSLSVVDTQRRMVTREIRFFRPGDRNARGEYPFWVAVAGGMTGESSKVYVSSLRDGEIMEWNGQNVREIKVGGAPNKMLLSRDKLHLYVANGNLDAVDVINTNSDRLERVISLLRPGFSYLGANPNSLAQSADGSRLYVTLGGENAVAVVDTARARVLGRIPTGWYPSSVNVSNGHQMLYVVNTKSPSGPSEMRVDKLDNALPQARGVNGYVYNLEKAGLLSFPLPDGEGLQYLSSVVDANNGFDQRHDSEIMSFLHRHIKHVIYVMKENRTYDQVLGDLRPGNGDAHLVQFGKRLTPNNHELASQFVTLDNFYASGDVSADGWSWTFQARTNDYNAKSVAFDYGNGGFPYDWQGEPRNVNLSLPLFGPAKPYGERITTLFDASGSSTILPGQRDIGATEGAGNLKASARGGFIWDAVLRAALSHRDYGIYTSLQFYKRGAPFYLPIARNAFALGEVQAIPIQSELWGRTDPYYRGWDLNVPDQYRFEEWKREFDGYVKHGNLPNFEVVDLMNDHFGNFKANVGGLGSPESQIAMNDYALGELVEAVSHSPYWRNTAIIVVEDDAQDGPDHVDSHRTVAHVISAYTRRHRVVSTFYNTVAMLRTIEDLLGTDHLGIYDANTSPMSDVFTRQADTSTYTSIIPGILCAPPVKRDLVRGCANARAPRTAAVAALHDAAWWSRMTADFPFDQPDAIDSGAFNRLLWAGVRSGTPPAANMRAKKR
ncbi:MAG: bifunctional YncE family protein/alkaline phosphatase family protein [Candidatus Eremiobacteraeota bacterium]|nr:bifunctional YncE family protein/alkaline phosphatase family protein [Candidatus Eremiobacteraeota bacterium]